MRTVREFFNNPAGKGATFLNIAAIHEKFDQRYETVKDKISCTTCIPNDESIFYHVLFPSSVQGVFYDVVIGLFQVSTPMPDDMDMKVFSNCPSFLYTFAYAYEQQNMLLTDFKKKLSPKMLTDMAKAKNPYGVLSYDFSLYSALKYIIENNLLHPDNVRKICTTRSLKVLYREVANADRLQSRRVAQKNKIKEEKKAMDAKKNSDNDTSKEAKETKEVEGVRNSKKVSSIKSVKKVKKI